MSENELQIISPWMRNGDIVKYTKRYPNVSKKELVTSFHKWLTVYLASVRHSPWGLERRKST
jgi:hypothetical protein